MAKKLKKKNAFFSNFGRQVEVDKVKSLFFTLQLTMVVTTPINLEVLDGDEIVIENP